jgi:hypothetical protein
MLTAKRRFLFFGDYRMTELVCDACKRPISPDAELIGDIVFFPDLGVSTERCHYHPSCIESLDGEQKLMTHSRFFLQDFALNEWHKFWVDSRADEEVRTLHGFFLDSRSGLLKRVIQCGDCGLVAVLALPPTKSEARPEVVYYKWSSPEMLIEAPACSSNVERKLHWCGRPSSSDCNHAFLRLGESGNGFADYMAIRKQTTSDLASGEYDSNLMRLFGVDGDEVIQAAYESVQGFTWDWCSKCGEVVRLINSPRSSLPTSGNANLEDGRPAYSEGHVTQTRVIGAVECQIDSLH